MTDSLDDQANVLTDDQRQFFKKNGYIKLSAQVDPQHCEKLIDLIWTLLPQHFSPSSPSSWTGRIQDCCNNLPLYQRKGLLRYKSPNHWKDVPEARDAVYDNQTLRVSLSALLGRDLDRLWIRGLHPNFPFAKTVSVNELLGNRPDPDFKGGFWRRLRVPAPPQFPIFGHLETHALELCAVIYLRDVEKREGAFAVWPRSHQAFRFAFDSKIDFLPNKLYKRYLNLFQGYKPKPIAGRQGDVVVFHNRLMHTNTFNRSGKVRYAVFVDVMGTDENGRLAQPPLSKKEREHLKMLRKAERLEQHEPAAAILETYRPHWLSKLLVPRPRLREFIQRLSQDPRGDGRRHLSRQIRARVEGDCWAIVSQTDEYAASFKLDAYGTGDQGDYSFVLNDGEAVRSVNGIVVQRLQPLPGRNRIRIEGAFHTDHHIRIVRTGKPVRNSQVLLTDRIGAGAFGYCADFELAEQVPEALAPPFAATVSEAA